MHIKSIKNDLILLISILALALVILGLTRVFARPLGTTAVITIDGSEYAVLSLSEDTALTVSSDYGVNTVIVREGKVYVESADCPDKICAGHGGISRQNEAIVCLPHRLVIEIKDSEVTDFDAVSE